MFLATLFSAAFLPLAAQLPAASIVVPDAIVLPDMIGTRRSAPPSIEQDRLTVCLDQARNDPPTAILTASRWIGEASGPDRAFPNQCLGMAYSSLMRWQAAEQAFLAARDAAAADNFILQARLGAMAGNSAMADGRNEAALTHLARALKDAESARDTVSSGEMQIDRARALVSLNRIDEAGQALADARRDAPQNSDAWLLSATLARRGDDLTTAQAQIETAAGLNPLNPVIGLEAGLIAVLSGREDAARKSWQSVIDNARGTAEAETARSYLDQLGVAGQGAVQGEQGR